MIEHQKFSERERQRRAWQRAMSVEDFCQRYRIGRTSTYAQIKRGKLAVRKVGRRTLIGEDDAEEWWRSLPEHCGGLDEAAS